MNASNSNCSEEIQLFNRQLEMLYQHTKMKLKDACEAIFEFLAQVTTHEGGCAIVLGFSFDICRSEISASKHRINSGFFATDWYWC